MIESSTAITATFLNAIRDPNTGDLFYTTTTNKVYQLRPMNETTAPKVVRTITLGISNIRAGAIATTNRHLYYVSILIVLKLEVD